MTDFLVCIACLSSDIKMCCVSNTQLPEIYDTVLPKEFGIPKTMCYFCYAQLQKCCRFMNMAERSGQILTQLFNDGVQITKESVSVIDKKSINNFVTTILQPTLVPSSYLRETGNAPSSNLIKEIDNTNIDKGFYVTDAQITITLKQEHRQIDEKITFEEELITIKEEPMDVRVELINEKKHLPEKEQKYKNLKEAAEKIKAAAITHQLDASETIASGANMPDNDLLKLQTKPTKKKKGRSYKKSHACNSCDMSFSCHAYLMRHSRVHTGEKPFVCKTCDKTFAQNSHLVQHMRLHTGEKPYICHICKNKAFNHRYNYKTHMRKHFGVPSHTCDLCNSAFHQKADLKRHIMSHTGEKPHTCIKCNMKFSQNCHLTKHLRLHKAYTCTTCGLDFPQKIDLNNHLTIHTAKKPFSCSFEGCSKSFYSKGTLTNHLKSHKIERPHACVICDRTFKQKCHLLKHTSMIHQNENTQHDLPHSQIDIQVPPLLNQGELQDNLIENHYHLQENVEEYIIP